MEHLREKIEDEKAVNHHGKAHNITSKKNTVNPGCELKDVLYCPTFIDTESNDSVILPISDETEAVER